MQHETLQQRINQLFNTGLSHIQQYLFTQLRVPPSSKVQIQHDDGELISICTVSDNENYRLPFSTMQVEVIPFTEQEILDRDDPIKSIRVRHNSVDLMLEDDESTMLEQFFNYIKSKDPDIIVFDHHDLDILGYLLERIRLLSLDLQFGRKKTDIFSVDQRRILERWTQGRLYLTSSQYEDGLTRLSELSLFSYLPMRMIVQYSIGRLIPNRNLYELLGKRACRYV